MGSVRNTVYIGNDAPDVACMLHVGCGAAPADAYPVAKEAAQIVLSAGGYGCIRELADLLLGRRLYETDGRSLSIGQEDNVNPPIVIAEIGCNHRGELTTAEKMVRVAADLRC